MIRALLLLLNCSNLTLLLHSMFIHTETRLTAFGKGSPHGTESGKVCLPKKENWH